MSDRDHQQERIAELEAELRLEMRHRSKLSAENERLRGELELGVSVRRMLERAVERAKLLAENERLLRRINELELDANNPWTPENP